MLIRSSILFAILLFALPAVALSGSDSSGAYDYIDSNEVANSLRPVYNWESIAGTGTQIAVGDDDFVALSPGFSFNYFGGTFNQVWAQGNGFLSFASDTSPYWSNGQLPDTGMMDDAIVAWWDDLEPGNGKAYKQVLGNAPYRTLVYEANNYQHVGDANEKVTFQVRLHETFNTAEVVYLAANFDTWEAAAGIQGDVGGTLHGASYHWSDTDITTTTVQYRPTGAAPVGADDAYELDEDGTLVVAAGSGVLANDKQIGYAPLEPVLASGPAEGGLSLAADGSFTYTPHADFSGTDSFTYTLKDGWNPAGYAPIYKVNITVIERNDAPTFDAGSDIAVDEDFGLVTLPWATNMNDGSSNETQTLWWNITHDNAGLFSTPPTLLADGRLRFAAVPDGHGVSNVDVRLMDDGKHNGTTEFNRSAIESFTITVRPLDDPPQAVDDTASVDEDNVLLVDVLANDDDAPDAAETLSIKSVTGAANGATAIVGGQVRYTPNADYFGTETLTVTIEDSNGTSATSMLGITVNSINDAPTLTGGTAVSVLEDAGAQTISWATPSAGPANEIQTVSVATSDDNAALFAVRPAVDSTGTLSFTPADDAFGTATVTVTITDSGLATAPHDAQSVYTFTLTVVPVNDAPTGALAGAIAVATDHGPYSQTGFLTGLSVGPGNEAQNLATPTVAVDDTSLFTTLPSLVGDEIRFEPLSGMAGVATLTVTLVDDGGTSDGGVDTTVLTTTIEVLNEPPVAVDDTFDVPEGAAAFPIDVLANDSDANGHALSVAAVGAPMANGVATGSAAIQSGNLVLTTPSGFTGTLTFMYTLQDSLGDTDTANVTVTVADPATPMVRLLGPSLVCVGDTVNFAIESHYANAGLNHTAISFGDGIGEATNGGATAAQHAYSTKDAVTVSATSTFTDAASASDSYALTIHNCIAPEPDFRISLAGLTTTLTDWSTDADGTIVARDWVVDGTSYSGTTLNHVFGTYGTFHVELTVTDEEGNFASKQGVITVVAPKKTGATGQPVNDAGPEESAQETAPEAPAEQEAAAGNAAPVARIDAPASALVGVPFTISGATSSDADGDALTHRWTHVSGPFAGLAISGLTQELQALDAGALVLSLTVSDGGTSVTETVTIVVDPAPAPEPAFVADVGGSTVSFADASTAGADATSLWDFGDGSTSTAKAPEHTFEPGQYVVRLQITENGVTRETSQLITVQEAPAAPAEAAPLASQPTAPAQATVPVSLTVGVGLLALAVIAVFVAIWRKR